MSLHSHKSVIFICSSNLAQIKLCPSLKLVHFGPEFLFLTTAGAEKREKGREGEREKLTVRGT